MQNNLITNTNQLQNNYNFETLFNNWLFFIDVKATSFNTYNTTIKHFLQYLNNNEITQPTRQDVLNYRDYLINNNYKATTIKNKIQTLKNFFKWLEYENLYKNITVNIKTPKISDEYKHDYLTKDQIKLLLNSIDKSSKNGLRDYAIILLMLTSGLRVSEVINLNKQDIKIKNGYRVLYILGKGHETKDSYIVLTDLVYKAITECLESRTDDNESIFISSSNRNLNGRLTRYSIDNIVNKYFCLIGIKSDMMTAHSLRTTTATQNILNGGSLQQTQQLLRHKNIATTTIYTHLLEREQNKSEQRISNMIESLITANETQKDE